MTAHLQPPSTSPVPSTGVSRGEVQATSHLPQRSCPHKSRRENTVWPGSTRPPTPPRQSRSSNHRDRPRPPPNKPARTSHGSTVTAQHPPFPSTGVSRGEVQATSHLPQRSSPYTTCRKNTVWPGSTRPPTPPRQSRFSNHRDRPRPPPNKPARTSHGSTATAQPPPFPVHRREPGRESAPHRTYPKSPVFIELAEEIPCGRARPGDPRRPDRADPPPSPPPNPPTPQASRPGRSAA